MSLAPTEEFALALRGFTVSYFRLETLQVYRGSGEDDWLAAYQAGEAGPRRDALQDEWESHLRVHREAGHAMQRVHVVVEPLSEYLKFELAWMYAINVAGGEQVGIVDASAGWPPGVPHRDFHLFDSQVLFLGDYAADGTWLGVTRVDDMREIEAARRGRDAALHRAQPWETFIADRPELAARLPRATTC